MTRAIERTQDHWRVAKGSDAFYVTYRDVKAGARQDGARSKAIRAAVLGHIKALRALGKTRVNTRDIATALDLPRAVVEQAVLQLGDEGVKISG